MSSSIEAIRRVVAAFERSDWTEIDVRIGDTRVHLAAGAPNTPAPEAPESRRAEPFPAGPSVASSTGVDDAGPPPPTAPPVGAHVVVSPSPGIFWQSPEPGAPPFAAVGDTIEASATVCIVEVMKLMNHVKAGVGGRVVAAYGLNGVAVDKGQPLFAIEPDPPAGSSPR